MFVWCHPHREPWFIGPLGWDHQSQWSKTSFPLIIISRGTFLMLLKKKKKRADTMPNSQTPTSPWSLGHRGNLPSLPSPTCELHTGRNPILRQGESWRLTSEVNPQCHCAACHTTSCAVFLRAANTPLGGEQTPGTPKLALVHRQ